MMERRQHHNKHPGQIVAVRGNVVDVRFTPPLPQRNQALYSGDGDQVVIVSTMRDQIREVAHQDYSRYLPFIGTLFLFIVTSNLLAIVPGYIPPTGSLSTTTALAICVLVAVPLYGIAHEGLLKYLRHYIKPTPMMLPFNIIGELSRTIALAVRLYGNIMSGTVIVGILLSLTPFFFPIVMQLLGLITGTIQAYIFAILAMVYIASASSAHQATEEKQNPSAQKGDSHG